MTEKIVLKNYQQINIELQSMQAYQHKLFVNKLSSKIKMAHFKNKTNINNKTDNPILTFVKHDVASKSSIGNKKSKVQKHIKQEANNDYGQQNKKFLRRKIGRSKESKQPHYKNVLSKYQHFFSSTKNSINFQLRDINFQNMKDQQIKITKGKEQQKFASITSQIGGKASKTQNLKQNHIQNINKESTAYNFIVKKKARICKTEQNNKFFQETKESSREVPQDRSIVGKAILNQRIKTQSSCSKKHNRSSSYNGVYQSWNRGNKNDNKTQPALLLNSDRKARTRAASAYSVYTDRKANSIFRRTNYKQTFRSNKAQNNSYRFQSLQGWEDTHRSSYGNYGKVIQLSDIDLFELQSVQIVQPNIFTAKIKDDKTNRQLQ